MCASTLSLARCQERAHRAACRECTFAGVQAHDNRADLAEGRQPGVKHAGQAAGAQVGRPGNVGHRQLERDLHQRRATAACQGLSIHLRPAGRQQGRCMHTVRSVRVTVRPACIAR